MIEMTRPGKRIDNGGEREEGWLRERGKNKFELCEGKVMRIEREETCGELGVEKETKFEEMCVSLSCMKECGSC